MSCNCLKNSADQQSITSQSKALFMSITCNPGVLLMIAGSGQITFRGISLTIIGIVHWKLNFIFLLIGSS
ncbi:hypothetical protein GLOIN_2v1519799 [Rhizophagus irregularis DAOM 181602=DAOM 197198]|uniref:Uncharacterized protein n=1 Tax=Rhizophagus irregularis (strain DAOM 181602 / DAOM 197198 / MUCL 43194) TaxID=747089 RepID=A0A2P4QRH3_RHIID|nr:hypothetical protein GLOIN_2v1519799 [Rhizophagus irregularis DAOM 181602=DAOM 197198]POG80247.1 hypothetical protein GLOIN_2v1519799 [Rhizophagus irregularis DAOM 181602=DAOM 197198]|eukprot:XP_025187113.1 hypothetical protein GLOIN_2v1519799 [Rhizophagus irregularis DAOM 181602=DAOM 197198]